jgi:hypothetical protein
VYNCYDIYFDFFPFFSLCTQNYNGNKAIGVTADFNRCTLRGATLIGVHCRPLKRKVNLFLATHNHRQYFHPTSYFQTLKRSKSKSVEIYKAICYVVH